MQRICQSAGKMSLALAAALALAVAASPARSEISADPLLERLRGSRPSIALSTSMSAGRALENRCVSFERKAAATSSTSE